MSPPDADRPIDPTPREHHFRKSRERNDRSPEAESPHEHEQRTHPDDVVGYETIHRGRGEGPAAGGSDPYPVSPAPTGAEADAPDSSFADPAYSAPTYSTDPGRVDRTQPPATPDLTSGSPVQGEPGEADPNAEPYPPSPDPVSPDRPPNQH